MLLWLYDFFAILALGPFLSAGGSEVGIPGQRGSTTQLPPVADAKARQVAPPSLLTEMLHSLVLVQPEVRMLWSEL